MKCPRPPSLCHGVTKGGASARPGIAGHRQGGLNVVLRRRAPYRAHGARWQSARPAQPLATDRTFTTCSRMTAFSDNRGVAISASKHSDLTIEWRELPRSCRFRHRPFFAAQRPNFAHRQRTSHCRDRADHHVCFVGVNGRRPHSHPPVEFDTIALRTRLSRMSQHLPNSRPSRICFGGNSCPHAVCDS